MGWKANGSESYFDFDTPITTDTILYGVWTTSGKADDATSIESPSADAPLCYSLDANTNRCSISLNEEYLTEHEKYPETIVVPSTITTTNGETIDVTTIGENTFKHDKLNNDIKSISLPDSITSIDDCAFVNNASLQYINMPLGLKSTSLAMFANCFNLRKVEFNEGLVEVKDETFYEYEVDGELYPTYVKEATLPSTVTYIGSRAFANPYIEIVDLSKTQVTTLDNTFESSLVLKDVKLPQTLKILYDSVFYNCKSLTQIELPSQLEYIGNSALDNTNIEKITIPASVSAIDQYAFCGSERLKTVIFEANSRLSSINEGVFNWCSSLKNINLPSTIQSIGEHAFEYCKTLQQITIPKSVKSIGYEAFSNCRSLSNVKFEEGSQLVSLGEYAFGYCEGLTYFSLPTYVKYIGYQCFDESNLQFLNFEGKNTWVISDNDWVPSDDTRENAKTVLDATDDDEMNIKESFDTTYNVGYITDNESRCLVTAAKPDDDGKVTIPASLTDANGKTYKVVGVDLSRYWSNNSEYKSKIKEVIFGSTIEGKNVSYIEYIQPSAFQGCNNLTTVNFEALTSLWYIGEQAFQDCFVTSDEPSQSQLIDIDLSSCPIKSLSPYAFSKDSGDTNSLIQKIVLPDTLVSLGSAAFRNLNNLSDLDCSNCENLSTLEYAVGRWGDLEFNSIIEGTKIKELDLSNTCITHTPSQSFSNTEQLESIVLPDTVQIIQSNVFCDDIALKNFTVPENCYYIGNEAFDGCENLDSVEFKASSSEWLLYYNSGSETVSYKDITKTSDNAQALKDTYCDYTWMRTK